MICLEDLNEKQLDAMREIANVGAGHAVTALSQMISDRISMSVPSITVVPVNRICQCFGGPEEIVAGIFMKVFGDISGKLLFLFKKSDSQRLFEMIIGDSLENKTGSSQNEQLSMSVLKEVSNIMAGAYLNAISKLTGLNMLSSVPGYAYDMLGAIISSAIYDESDNEDQLSDSVLVIKTHLKTAGHEFDGNFFLIPDVQSLDRMFQVLGVN